MAGERLRKTWSRIIRASHPRFKGDDAREWFIGIGEGKYLGEGLPHTAMRREQTTVDIAEAVLFLALASEPAANITGQTLNIDGGMVKD
jgi:NAD(P)-dependent dehydrogenase (short-subunit alcohol dehydrogenase family)